MRHPRGCFILPGREGLAKCRAERGEDRVLCVEVGHPRSPVSRILSPNAVCVSVPVHVVFLQFAVQSRPMYAQRVRGTGDVVVSGFEGHVQGLSFNLFEREDRR